jgi:hypothetical protein
MTTLRDPDAILAAWLEEGPTRLPVQTRRAIVVAIPTTPQRRRGLVAPWRSTTMSTTLKLALGAAAVIAVALGGAYALGIGQPGRDVGGGPVASPTPTPVPTPTPWPFPTETSGGVPVAPGRYELVLPARTADGGPIELAVTFAMPAGWEKNVIASELWNIADQRRIGFYTVDNVNRDPCGADGTLDPFQPPLGPTVDDFVNGLAALTAVTATQPSDVSVAGFQGKRLTLRLTGAMPASCFDDVLNLWSGPQGAPTAYGGGALANDRSYDLLVLDVDGARLVVGRVADPGASAPALAEMQAIVDSVEIRQREAGPSASPQP